MVQGRICSGCASRLKMFFLRLVTTVQGRGCSGCASRLRWLEARVGSAAQMCEHGLGLVAAVQVD